MKMYRRQLRLLRNILYLRENSRVKVNEARQVHGFGDSRGGDGGHSDDMAFDANIRDKTVSTKEVISDKRIKRKAFVNARFPILLFPGQGSQFVGMGKKALHYPGVKEMYEEISEHFRKDILKLCLLGPKEELDKTINCQPAVFITSLAAVEMMKELYPEILEGPTCMAGYSLGEITACVCAGVLSFTDALTLLNTRAYSMQEASEEVGSGMLTMTISHQSKLGLAKEAAMKFCKSECGILNPVVQTASYLTPYHKVVAGHNEALDFISDTSQQFGLKGCKRLPVSGAFHTMLMDSARKEMYSTIKNIDVTTKTKHRVYYNVTGKTTSQENFVKKNLCEQLVHPIKWEQAMQSIYGRPLGEEFPQTYEVGPGGQLGYILRLINKKAYSNYRRIEV
ncbi:malonyl-CoA-acyl carrier protein transacylase, mitochondrial-like [Crassostrea angulata]|nr:malonyl-CoA-acyl carrier protein transacylase, mitochondrial-like [Crassostrea angulata]